MNNYICPPKLRQKLLLAGLSVWEIFVILSLLIFNLMLHNFMAALFYPALVAALFSRIFDGKSLKDLFLIVLRYHTTPQMFTSHHTLKGNRYEKKRTS